VASLMVIIVASAWTIYTERSRDASDGPKFVAVESWDSSDLFDPETALGHGIPGCIKLSYAAEPPKTTFVVPGKDVRYDVVLELIPYRDDFTETLVVLEPWRSGGSGVNGVMLSDHVRYENLTCFALREGHPVKVNMVYSVS
jgi:hypothetical protein